MVLYTPPADRELGLRHLLDAKRFSKLLRDGGLAEPGLVRRRRTSFELVRYKPERRAVYRVEIHLRDEQRTGFALAVRVLPSAQAASVISRAESSRFLMRPAISPTDSRHSSDIAIPPGHPSGS